MKLIRRKQVKGEEMIEIIYGLSKNRRTINLLGPQVRRKGGWSYIKTDFILQKEWIVKVILWFVPKFFFGIVFIFYAFSYMKLIVKKDDSFNFIFWSVYRQRHLNFQAHL